MGEMIRGRSGSFGGGARRTETCGMSSITVLRCDILRVGTDGLNVVEGRVMLAMLDMLD